MRYVKCWHVPTHLYSRHQGFSVYSARNADGHECGMVMRGALIGAEQRHIRPERVSDVVKLEKQRSCNGGRN